MRLLIFFPVQNAGKILMKFHEGVVSFLLVGVYSQRRSLAICTVGSCRSKPPE